jgi:hypothetical protein
MNLPGDVGQTWAYIEFSSKLLTYKGKVRATYPLDVYVARAIELVTMLEQGDATANAIFRLPADL